MKPISAVARRYRKVLAGAASNHAHLHFQLQMYAGAVGDPRDREIAREHMAKMFGFIVAIEGVDAAMATDFLATGMLLNVLGALGIDYSPGRQRLPAALRGWAQRCGSTAPAAVP